MMRCLGLTIASVSWIHAALVTSQTVSCTDEVTNLVTNPEFDSGLTGWSTSGNNWAVVSASSSSDGLAYAENVITSGNSFYVYQTVSGYEIGEEYTVSVDARLAVGSGATTTQCIFEVLIHVNGGSYTVQQSTSSITSSSSSWLTLSETFKPTYSSITLYALAYCQSGTIWADDFCLHHIHSNIHSNIYTNIHSIGHFDHPILKGCPKLQRHSIFVSYDRNVESIAIDIRFCCLGSLFLDRRSEQPARLTVSELDEFFRSVHLIHHSSTPTKSSSSPGSPKFTPSGNPSNTASSSQPAIFSPTSVATPLASVPVGSSPDHIHSSFKLMRPSSAPAYSSPVTVTTLQTTALVSGAHTASPSSQETQSLSPSSDITSQHTLSETHGGSTTSTVFTTRTATITACPNFSKDRTTHITTETIVLSTTVCPITAEETATQSTSSHELPSSTTSTVLSTRTATITACPSGVTKCPVASQSTYVTTEMIVVSTTVCPITAAEATASPTIDTAMDISPATASSEIFPALSGELTTETLLEATTRTITACLSTVTDCPASQKSTYTTIETFVATVTVAPSTNTPGLLPSASETTGTSPSSDVAAISPVESSNASTVGSQTSAPAEIIAQSTTTQTLQEQSDSAANASQFPYSTPAAPARISSHSFLTSASSSAATEASNPFYSNSATSVPSASQVPGMTTTSAGSVYTGSASAIRSEWTKIVGVLFLVMLV
ncbi:hypothetical protein N7504_007191 [Penicillium tannophilum]|nr:hypothetical protein N7504_007191 [Penicillium tannophilum]